MSTVLEQPETIFDFETPPIRLGPESNGMELTREEFLAVEDVDELYRYELIHGVVVVSPPAAEGERDPNGELEYCGESAMQTVEFQTTVIDGTIEVPREYQEQFRDRVKVTLQTIEPRSTGANLIDELLARPLKLSGFQPLTREEAHAR